MPLPDHPSLVLVVEDEALQRLHLVWLLEEAGFSVLEAPNADSALLLLKENKGIRLVVTDVDMPGTMDGLKLAHIVRGRWPPMELIVISGRYSFRAEDLPSRARFLAKPYGERPIVELAKQLTTM